VVGEIGRRSHDGISSYFRWQWRLRLYRPYRACIWSRVSSWVDFSSRHHHRPLPILPSPSLPLISPARSRFVNSRDFLCVFNTHTRTWGVPSFNLHDGTWDVCGRATGNPPRRFRNLMQNDFSLLSYSETFLLHTFESSILSNGNWPKISISLRELLLSSSD